MIRRRLLMQKPVEKNDGWNYIMCKLNVTTTTARTTCISTSFTGSAQVSHITFNEPDTKPQYPYDTGFQFTWVGERVMYIHFKEGVTNLNSLFANVTAVTYIDMNMLDTRYVRDMGGMCMGCTNLVQCLMSECRADSLISTVNMFNSCSALKWTDFGSYITGNFKPKLISDARNMFNYCRAITTINLSMFDFSNCTQFGVMFGNCYALTEVYMNSPIRDDATIPANMFVNSSAANAKLYYNGKKHDYSKIKAVLPSNWTLTNYNY